MGVGRGGGQGEGCSSRRRAFLSCCPRERRWRNWDLDFAAFLDLSCNSGERRSRVGVPCAQFDPSSSSSADGVRLRGGGGGGPAKG